MGEQERVGEAMNAAPVRCILVHGFNGEPMDLCEVERSLEAHGFATSTLLLPGHGTSVDDFATARWEDWIGTVNDEVSRSLARGERVVLIGHSMGGALSFAVAEQVPGVAGVVAMCAPTALDRGGRAEAARWKRAPRYILSFGEDVRDRIGAMRRYERHAYWLVPIATALSLFDALPRVREALPAISCPTLLIYARNDHVVPLADGIAAYKRLGAREKRLVVLPRSFHAVTKDVEREIVCEHVVVFCERLREAGPKMGTLANDEARTGTIDRIC